VFLLAIHVGLVSLHGPLDVGELDTPKLNTAIESGESELQLQLEVSRTAAAPDQEGVLLGLFIGGCLADDRPVLHFPERRVAIPSGQRLAIENRVKAALFEWRDLSRQRGRK